jgi:hypothetical protein
MACTDESTKILGSDLKAKFLVVLSPKVLSSSFIFGDILNRAGTSRLAACWLSCTAL